jgi:hypothetical protein
MAQVKTKYIVYNHGGTGVRHHHFSSANTIIDTTTDNYPGSTDANPGTHTCYGFAQSPDNNHYPFLFMSVAGNKDNNHLLTTAGNYTIQVGASDVNVLVVYGPAGGTSVGGQNGVWVDAFNLDAGNFSDDLHFISVLTPPEPGTLQQTVTDFANQEGGVVTANGAEIIRASDTIDSGVPFLEWKKLGTSDPAVMTKDVALAQNETNEIWFAFYQTIPPSRSILKLRQILTEALGRWEDDDYCGTHPPHVPIGPNSIFEFTIDPKVVKALPADAQKVLSEASKQYPDAAMNAYKAMSTVITMLGTVGKALRAAREV